ncbi:Calmodulin-like protein 8 [Phytophthora citrophthora]|uniref:Calmodulin-like protein 8 n=1 Tax=Phytophthora citrophthora TaxID=4793 RepID=A0AAD9GZH1_9STRA|nr:Calmodulin-like protein 8 [Phytophthora citrophthora]
MSNNNNDDDRRWGRTASSAVLPPAPPVLNAKTQALLHRRRRRAPPRDVEQHEPWLFQSSNVRPLPVMPTSLPSLSLSPSDNSLFYLDLKSLKSLLPPSDGRRRPKSSEDDYSSYRGFRGPSSRGRLAPPARLEALNLSTTHAVNKPHRHRKRRRQMGLTSKQKLRRKALRLDSAKVRPTTQELLDADTAAVYLSPTKRARNKASKKHKHVGEQRPGSRRRPAKHYAFDYDSDGQDQTEKPAPPLEDLDEEQRQKTLIATHLNLTLEEYERLDAAFGNDSHASIVSEDERSMTERYYEEFHEFDVDNSGSISPEELQQLLLASGEDMDDAELASIIQQADTDHDGEINFDEFIALMRARKRLLLVANTMGVTGTGPITLNSTTSPGLGLPSNLSSHGQVLPPLKLVRQTKRHAQPQKKALIVARQTPSCLRPGSKVDVGDLRRELALSEYGIQELNSKVREGLQWVQQHCPVRSLKAQIFCHRWGMEKVHHLFKRLQAQQLSRAFRKWNAFLMFERNKIKANMFLKCKGSQKMTAIMNKWRRRVTRRKFAHWKKECILDARNELHSAAIEIQRVVRGDLARLLRLRMQEDVAVIHIQALIRGRLARAFAGRIRQAKLEHNAACLLQHCYRGYTGKRLARALFKAQRETLAACRIQRAFRNFQRRELLKVIQQTKLENDSAIVLQCCIRSYLARRERKRLATRRLQEQSAVVLQRCMRGYLARCLVLRMKQQICAALTIQCFFRVCHSRHRVHMLRTEKERKARHALEQAAATRIQTRWRCFITRRRYLLDKQRRVEAQKLERFRRLTSAVAIQSLFRGYLARRRAQRERFEKLKWMNLTLMNSSALKIQAFWRGYHGRLASHLRLQAQKAHEHQENEAAKLIQVIARGKLARDERRRLHNERAKLASQHRTRIRAALRIQKVFRGKQARKMVQEVQRKHREEARLALERLVHQTKTRAATKIQSCARRFLARCHYFYRKREMDRRKKEAELRITQNQAAIVIQCAMRRAGARRILLQRRREFEKRISMMASEKAHDEIERLRQEQEEELLKLKMQLMFQASSANEEAAKLREELDRQREEEEVRRKEEAQELARLRLETLMQQRDIDTRIEQDKQKKLEAARLRERLEAEKQAQQEKEAAMRSQENEELAAMKLATMLQSRPTSKQEEQDKEDRTLQQEAAHLKLAAQAIQKDQARMKIQAICLKHIARKRLGKLQEAQAAAMASLYDEEQRLRLKAEQQKELALARLKTMMDDEARAREQEIKELEVEMLERARKEKERIALRNSSARKIQSRARGYLDRQRVKAIQLKIEKEREDRAKAMQETIEAAEAEVAEALIEAGEAETEAEGSEETKADEWVEYWDENAQASYFYNIRTQEASWTRPISTPKAMDMAMAATGVAEESEQNAAPGYIDYAVTGQVDANGYPVAATGAESYADEYGYYDQYGQYHYYEQNNAGYYGNQAYGQGYPQMMGMQPDYAAAAAAANYAYQAAAAMAFGQAMMYGAPMMGFANPGMVPSTQQYSQATEAAESAPAETQDAGEAVPPDPWEKFFDQYTGAAYYYNNITGEQYWA